MNSNASAVPEKEIQRYSLWESVHRYCHDNWVLELAAVLLSIVITVAIAVVLKAFE